MCAQFYEDMEEILLESDAIQARIKELGEQISADYAGKEVILICILKGAVIFFSDLARSLKVQCQMDFMGISSYGDGTKTSGIVRIAKDIDCSITAVYTGPSFHGGPPWP